MPETVTSYVSCGFVMPAIATVAPDCTIFRSAISGWIVIWPSSNLSASSGLLNWIVYGTPGGQRPPHPHSAFLIASGGYVRNENPCAAFVPFGPSADGVPASIDTETCASFGSGFVA